MTFPLGEEESLIERLDAERTREEILLRKQEFCEHVPKQAKCILDVGSSTGDDALALAELLGPETEIVGVELRRECVEEARRRARNVALNVRFVEGDPQALPFLSGRFDVVRADGLWSRGYGSRRLLRELVRVLSAGGTLLIHEIVEREPSAALPEEPDADRLSADELAYELTRVLEAAHGRDAFVIRKLRAQPERDSATELRGLSHIGFTWIVSPAEALVETP